MKTLAKLTTCFAAAALAAALGGCNAVKDAQNSFHSSFRTSFRTSFIKSCSNDDAGRTKFCECAESSIEHKFTDDELISLTAQNSDKLQKAVQDATKACSSKLG